MKKSILVFCLTALVASLTYGQKCGPFEFPGYSVYDTADAKKWGGRAFELSANYPAAIPAAPGGGYPWEKIDFRSKGSDYLSALLNYGWEGMEDAKWIGQDNKVRVWYHAPWMHDGYTGREFTHGLVMDRTTDPKTLSEKQTEAQRSYSITYYNAEAAYALGQVWCDPLKPNAEKAKFPVGSVIMKLHFTTADTSQVPHLIGAMEWEAFVEKSIGTSSGKSLDQVRLLEIDFAVRTNSKEASTGWVYGVLVYNGKKGGADVKSNFVPLGVQWGNDPSLKPEDVEKGKPLTQVWINTSAWNQKEPAKSLVQKIGYGFRLQGPLGNPAASILSQHMAATWPIGSLVPPKGVSADSAMFWYRNLANGTPFEKGKTSLDHSLELRMGLMNHAINGGDSLLGVTRSDEVSEMLGFRPADPSLSMPEFEEEVNLADEGLTGRNLWVFIGFVLLVLTLIGLLVWNFLRGRNAQ